MAYVAIADQGQELSHPHSFVTKYIWSQDHKVIAIQYSHHRHRGGSRRAGLVLRDAAAAGFPRHFLVYRPQQLLPERDHARHDHGDLFADRAVPGGLRQLPDPAAAGCPGHGVPVHEHAQLLGLPAVRNRVAGQFLRTGRTNRCRLDPVSTASDLARHTGR